MAALVLACFLAAVIAVLFGRLDGEFQSMGNRRVPEVDAATGMYFSLNDMDAQVANVLLLGGNASLAADRADDLTLYGNDRAAANQDLQQATVTEAGDASAQRDLGSVLNRIGQYEALAADALLTSQQAGGSAGRPPAASVGYYQQATDLMQNGILPDVDSLTSVSASEVNTTYQAGLATARTGIVGVLDRGACGAGITGLGTVAGAALRASIGPIAKPHTSQKSSSADSCPDGQVAISSPR